MQSVKAICVDGRWLASVDVYLQFHNSGDSSVILYPPSWMFDATLTYGSEDLRRSSSVKSLRYNPYLDSPYGTAPKEDYDPKRALFHRFDTDAPISAGMVTIEPGGFFEFRDTLVPESGFKITISPIIFPRNSKSISLPTHLCGPTRATATSDYSSFRIQYDLGLRKRNGFTDFVRSLQKRWKPFGELMLDGNDDFTYETKEILFDAKK